MIWLITIIFSLISGLLYRFGGLGEEDWKKRWSWVPKWMINSNTRDIGCSFLTIIWMFLFYSHAPFWIYLISLVLQKLAYSTYWDKVPFNKGEDNFWMHGFFIALATFLIISMGLSWEYNKLLPILLGLILLLVKSEN